jgi:tetratricopeptide (TPR) repeat protein
MSLMRRHQEAVRAGTVPEAGRAAPDKARTAVVGVVPTGFMAVQHMHKQLGTALAEDLAALSALQSVERKADMKRDTLLPKYAPYVEQLRKNDQRHELLGWYLVWLLDAGDIEQALEYGMWCIARGVTLPEKFRRTVPALIADALADWAEPLVERGESAEPYLTRLLHAADGVCGQWDLPDAVSARLLKIYGEACARSEQWDKAVDAFEAAYELGAKVKTVLDKARKQLNKAE